MNLRDQLVHTTVRIGTVSSGSRGTGSGFFMNFCDNGKVSVPAIVTNKHVVAGAINGRIFLTACKADADEPDLGNLIPVPIDNFESHWIFHPDPKVDIAVFPIAPLLDWLKQEGKSHPFYKSFNTEIIADAAFLSELTAIEDVLMIGYPIGLWDSKHNFPIVRRGITATPPYVDFNGEPQFVIDAACFPGSSGSPVLLYDDGGYRTKDGDTILGASRIKLLGILFAGPQHTAEGEIQVRPIPTAAQPIALSRIPSNLGYCVKAEQLHYFEKHFSKQLEAEAAAYVASAKF